ncbi:MAG: hypothetical protein JSV03_07305, partial [Planctomycetota bacterium]
SLKGTHTFDAVLSKDKMGRVLYYVILFERQKNENDRFTHLSFGTYYWLKPKCRWCEACGLCG